RVLRHDGHALLAHGEASRAIALRVVADLFALADDDALVEDGAPHTRMTPDLDALEEHALFDERVAVHAHAWRQHRAMQPAARDDATIRDERVRRETDALSARITEDELRGRVVAHRRAHAPLVVVQIEARRDLDEVHLRLPVTVDRADVAPVAAVPVALA